MENTGAPNGSFLSDPLKRYFRLPGMTLKLCKFILGRASYFYLFGHLSLFDPFPESLRSYCLSENLS